MKRFFARFALIGGLAVFLVGLVASETASAQTRFQELTSSGEGNVQPGPSMSPDDAYSYVVKVFNTWVKAQNAKMEQRQKQFPNMPPGFNPQMMNGGMMNGDRQELEAMGQQIASLGFTNLSLIQQQFVQEEKKQNIPIETYTDLMTMVGSGLRLSITDADLPHILSLAATDPRYIGYLSGHPDWLHRPEVIQFLKDKWGSAGAETSAFARTTGGNGDGSGDDKSDLPSGHAIMLSMILKSQDPAFQDIINQEVQAAAQNSAMDSHEFDTIFDYCLLDKTGQYTAIIPGLFATSTTLRQNAYEKHKERPHDHTADIFDFLAKNPKSGTDTQMQQTARAMLDFYDKENPQSSIKAKQRDTLEALLGNAESFGKITQHYIADEAQYQGSQHDHFDAFVIDSIAYSGPGERKRGIIDNLNAAAFDSNKGQWVITAPANYTSDASVPVGSDLVKQKMQDMIQSQDADDKNGMAIQTELNYFNPPSTPIPACVLLYPDLLKVYTDNRQRWEKNSFFPYSENNLFRVLGRNPSLCLVAQLHDTGKELVDRNETLHVCLNPDEAHAVLDAFFGDRFALDKVIQHYQDNQKPGGKPYEGDKELLSSLVYKGQGGRLQGILDNQNTAKFDSNSGQWTVTAPDTYTNTAKDPYFMTH